MGRMQRGIVLAAGIAVTSASGAAADLRICNETTEPQSVALGFKGETDWTSKGWWNIEPGACATVVAGELTQRYYYYFADSPSGGFQGQRYLFCTEIDAFDIVGDTECVQRGYQEVSFREIDTGETATSFTLTLEGSKGSDTGDGERLPGGGAEAEELGTQTVNEMPTETDLGVDMASLTTDMPPGRHGDPFEVFGFFQGCELENGRASCAFHSGGVKMRVFYGGPTPDELLFALEEMAMNAPVAVEGDALDGNGQERAVVVREVRMHPGGDPLAEVRAALQGDWVSEADAMSEITIRGSEIYVRYEGAFKASRFLQLETSCAGGAGSGPFLVQMARGTPDATCYDIADASDRLVLRPVKGGDALQFRRP